MREMRKELKQTKGNADNFDLEKEFIFEQPIASSRKVDTQETTSLEAQPNRCHSSYQHQEYRSK